MATYASDLIQALRAGSGQQGMPSTGGVEFLPNPSVTYSPKAPKQPLRTASIVDLRNPTLMSSQAPFAPDVQLNRSPRSQTQNFGGSDGYFGADSVGGRGSVGQGINSDLAGLGLGMMSYGERGMGIVPGSFAAGMFGSALAGQQVDAMGRAADALSAINSSALPGVVSVSDQNGNVFGFSSPATIAAADAAMFGDSVGSDAYGGYGAADGVGMSGWF